MDADFDTLEETSSQCRVFGMTIRMIPTFATIIKEGGRERGRTSPPPRVMRSTEQAADVGRTDGERNRPGDETDVRHFAAVAWRQLYQHQIVAVDDGTRIFLAEEARELL